jgi:hypothetical protein
MEMKVNKAHFEKYETMTALAEVNDIVLGRTQEEWKKLFQEDEWLNTVDLGSFDCRFYFGRTLAENTSAWKHIIRFKLLGVKPVF